MKKTSVKTVLATLFAATLMSFTTADAQETFIYGEGDNSMIVSTLNADGISITPKLKYEYQYSADGNLTEKKAYRWNASDLTWNPTYMLTYISDGSICLIEYAEWNKNSETFSQNCQQSIYFQDTENGFLLTENKK